MLRWGRCLSDGCVSEDGYLAPDQLKWKSWLSIGPRVREKLLGHELSDKENDIHRGRLGALALPRR